MATNGMIHFFRQKSPYSAPKTEFTVHHPSFPSAHQDLFLATSAAFIDVLQDKKISLDSARLILNRHKPLFPQVTQAIAHLSFTDQLHYLARNPGKSSTFLYDFAFTLRQLTIDEICSAPKEYRSILIRYEQLIAPTALRRDNANIAIDALHALSKKLQLPVELAIVAPDKPLANRIYYGKNAKNPGISLQICAGQIAPEIHHLSIFNAFKQVPQPDYSTIAISENSTLNVDVLTEQTKHIHTLENRFEGMIQREETSVDALIAVYIELPKIPQIIDELEKENSPGPILGYQEAKQKGIEHAMVEALLPKDTHLDTDDFFDSLEKKPKACNG